MPIRFACEHCNSVLSVSSRKAGLDVTCPKCRQKTPVPQVVRETAAVGAATKPISEAPSPSLPAPAAAEDVAAPTSEPSTVAEVESVPPQPTSLPDDDTWVPPPPADAYDTGDEVTWVYDAGTSDAGQSAEAGTVDFNRISLPRFVLYGQGILLLGVAMLALTLGILIGRGSAPKTVAKSGVPTPCFLTGKVLRKTTGGQPVPDAGAVVIVVPQDRRPTDKAPVEGLRPDDPLPEADQPSISRIKTIGGDYARADEQGYFKLRIPDSGEYFLLVVSHDARRKASQRLDPVHLAQMGRYFLPAPDLIGDRDYRWRAEAIKRDKEYTFTFE